MYSLSIKGFVQGAYKGDFRQLSWQYREGAGWLLLFPRGAWATANLNPADSKNIFISLTNILAQK